MKKKLGILSLLALTALVPVACNKSDDSNNDDTNQTDSLQDKIDAAKAELQGYASTKLNEADVEDTNNTVSAIVERFNNEVSGLNSISDIDAKLTIAKNDVDSAVNAYKANKDEEALNELKASLKTQLEVYASTELTENNLSNDTSVTSAVAAGKSLIDSASNQDSANEAFDDAKDNVDIAINALLKANQSSILANYKVTKTNEIDQYKISKLNENSVESSNDLDVIVANAKTAINQAVTIDSVDEAVIAGKAAIDAEIAKIVNAKELADAKASAKVEINQYVITKATEESISDLSELQAIANNACTSIDGATSKSDVTTTLANAKQEIDDKIAEYKNAAAEQAALAAYKVTKISEIQATATSSLATASVSDDGTVSSLVTIYTANINDASSIAGVDSIVSEYETNLTSVINALVAKKELADAKVNAKSEIESYATTALANVGLSDSSSIAVINSKVNVIKTTIDEKTTTAEVASVLTNGKSEIDALIASLLNMSEADKLTQVKENAKLEIESYASAQLSLYSLTDDGKVEAAVAAGKASIDEVASISDLEQAISNAKASIDSAIAELVLAKEAKELAQAKENAISSLEDYVEEQLSINNLTSNIDLTSEKALINGSTTIELVSTNLEASKDSVDEKINVLIEAKQLVEFKTSAISTLNTYANTQLSSNNLSDDGTISAVVNAGSTNINNAETIEDAQTALKNATDAVDSAISVLKANALASAKTNAISTISTYATTQLSANNVADDGTVQVVVDGAASRINACTTLEAVTSVTNTIKAEIDSAIAVIVAEKEAESALANAIASAKAELLDYMNTAISSNGITDDGTVNTAYTNGISAIEVATSVSAVQTALTNAKANVNNAVNAIVLKALISTKQAELESYADSQIEAYTITDDGSIAAAVIAGKQNIAAQATSAAVLIAFNNAKSSVDSAVRLLMPVDDSIINTLSYTYAENETIAAEWTDAKAEAAVVEYKLNSDSTWTTVDEELVRDQNGIARVDIVGLKGDSYYDVRILAGHGGTVMYMDDVFVSAYDRSGYAHFNNTEGVGAYNDDGTLKDDAIVIYVTDENKDSIQVEGYESAGTGIGWLLNNAQYSKQGSNTVKSNPDDYGLYPVTKDHPVAIRFIGTVTSPDGLTEYDSTNNGGTVGDNGHMARMKNLRNVTVEGIGEDAIIKGWGMHFICSDTTGQYGRNFEARNLTFDEYPEDALGMEGVQGTLGSNGTVSGSSSASSDLCAPVERCWVHHCTFLPGYCANPAESDKAEGDGSCDFKRGQYYTMSYCYYEYCHKTNLIGSSDTSLQYNISMHHNIWYQCGSRIPLLRQANTHFYNNYVYIDIADSSAEISYIHSLRANGYLFSEANYYEGCKQVTDGKTGGAGKFYNNVYTGCFDANVTVTESRTAKVSNACKFQYRNIDYSSFDTDSTLFYYDSKNQVSDCYLTDAVTARNENLQKSGSLYRTQGGGTSRGTSTASNKYTPTSSVDLSNDTYTATLSNDTGILYNGVSGGKFKGQGITFKLSDYAKVTVSMTGGSSSAMDAGSLVGADGTVYLTQSGSAELAPGIYYIASCVSDKQTTVSSLTFEKINSEELNKQRIDAYNALVAEIPSTIAYTSDCYNKIKAAMDAYDTLGELQSQVSYTEVEAAYNSYVSLGISTIEGLINSIGTVTQNSYSAISAARTAYDSAIQAVKSGVGNLSTLVAAEQAYESFAAQNVIDAIAALADASTATTKSAQEALLVEYNNVKAMYDALSTAQQANVTNYSKLSQGINTLEVALAPYTVIELINAIPATVTISDGATITAARTAYDALTTAQQALVTNYDVLVAAEALYEELASAQQVLTFDTGKTGDNDFFTVSGNLKSGIAAKTYNGVTYTTALKMESATSITFTLSATQTVTLVTDGASKQIKINGTSYDVDSNGILVVEGLTGSISVSKDDSMNLYAIIVG